MCKIVSNNLYGVTMLSNRFIDDYMVDADECALKVYIYLQRIILTGADVDVKKIADALDITVTKTKKALKSWRDKGLLELKEDEKGNIVQIGLLEIPEAKSALAETAGEDSSAISGNAASDAADPSVEKQPVIIPKYTKAQMDMFAEDYHFIELCDRIPKLVSEKAGYLVQFKPADLKTLAGIYESLGFSDELIEFLYSYCAGNGHVSSKYIEAVATSWASEGVTTVKEASYKTNMYNELLGEMKRVLGKRSDFGSNVVKEIESWVYDYGMDSEVIIYACDRAASGASDTPFNLVRHLINDWHEKNVKTVEEAKNCVDDHKNAQTVKKTAAKASKTAFASYEQRQGSGNALAGFIIEDGNSKAKDIKKRLASH